MYADEAISLVPRRQPKGSDIENPDGYRTAGKIGRVRKREGIIYGGIPCRSEHDPVDGGIRENCSSGGISVV